MTDQKITGAPLSETDLGRALIEERLATEEEVARCVELFAKAKQNYKTLSQVFVDEAVVTARQLERVVQKKVEVSGSSARQIPGYRIISKLGAGAMATVFKARQNSLDRIVAIKVLPREMSDNAEYVDRFYKEGKAAAKLNHPNIVAAYDVGEAGGYHYFVMEYVEGHTLHDDLVGNRAMEEARALQVITQVALALEHAHKQGFIHRDVKPKNIMITTEGIAKLADMGLARATSDIEAAKAEAGRAFGTPYYISPEQIRGEVDIDFRADIYSLGATLYHMVTGRVPFDGPTPAAVMHKHLKEPLIPPDHVNTNISTGLGEVVEVMMAKDRKQRYASTRDLIIDLELIAAGNPPLQARRRMNADVLTGLAGGNQPPSMDTADLPAMEETPSSSAHLIVYVVLGAALAISIIVNIVLLASSR